MGIGAGVVASAAVGGRIESDFATVGCRAVTIAITGIAGAKLAGATANPGSIRIGTGGRAAAAMSRIRSQ
jgi:hypothetical protein